MRVKPPKDLRLQCATCGVPVEVLQATDFDPDTDSAWATVEPCGHAMRFCLAP